MPRSKVSPEAFVRAWQTSATLADAAKTMGLSVAACFSRAGRYRARGIPLKPMTWHKRPPRVPWSVNVEELSRIAKEALS